MYTCKITGKTTKHGEKLNRLTVATREKIYYEKVWEDDVLVELEVARGFEIVREIDVSHAGLEIWNNWSDEERQEFVRSI